MSAFKKLTKSDVIVIPYVAKKEWNFPSSSANSSYYIFTGKNLTGSFNPNNEPTTSLGEYQRLVFNSINQLFYQQYTNTLNTHSLASSLYYESASIFKPTGSYFIYNENPKFNKYFPTGTNETIKVLSFSPSIYGQKISPFTFKISSSIYILKDDGLGNIYIAGNHAGNIFYSHGLVVVTNQDYQSLFDDNPTFGSTGDFNFDFNDDYFV